MRSFSLFGNTNSGSFSMNTAALVIGFVFICIKLSFGQQEVANIVQWECRDRYLWIHVASEQTPQFEAIDENGVHSISEQLASRCGYTVSTFKLDGFTTFRASYYSCFTNNRNDQTFNFRFNVMVIDRSTGWVSHEVSAVCSGLSWTHREIICEEDYMEVTVNREPSCGAQPVHTGQVQRSAFSQAQKTSSAAWQLMFQQGSEEVTTMSIGEAERRGYSLTATTNRLVFRSPYSSPQGEVMTVDGIPVDVVQCFLYYKQKLIISMIDISVACTVNSGSLDGGRLLWNIPKVLTPLVDEGASYDIRSQTLGVEGVLLDEATSRTRGFSLIQKEGRVQVGVPFGALGGYRKSLVENNMYKEMYVIFLLYEHVFSQLYGDGSRVDTRHRMSRVLDTPFLCRPPFTLDRTVGKEQVFKVYLGNIPADVELEALSVNGKVLTMETPEHGTSISPITHANGSRGYELQLPFEDPVVHWMYMGEGVVQYSIDINFTLTIMSQRESYYHNALSTVRIFNAFPPKITAQCLEKGITFSVIRPPRAESIWEVGVDQEPLTDQLADQRGYRLYENGLETTLEVPVSSVGYTYDASTILDPDRYTPQYAGPKPVIFQCLSQDINLSNFYGTFTLILRDSKTLEVQTSTSKRCLFKTEDMIDGTMTVVTTPDTTWPMVQPDRTTLLDPKCKPRQTDGTRVLFEFRPDSCGTRNMVGDTYVVYENEILHDRQMIYDGPNTIFRDSQFKLTVRCFYPLSAINRLAVGRTFASQTPGFGSVDVFGSLKDTKKSAAPDCINQGSVDAVDSLPKPVQETSQASRVLSFPGTIPRPKPGPSRFISVSGRQHKLSPSSPNKEKAAASPRLSQQAQRTRMSHSEEPYVIEPPMPSMNILHNSHSGYDPSQSSLQLPHINTPNFQFLDMRGNYAALTDDTALSLHSLGSTTVVSQQLDDDWGSTTEPPVPQNKDRLDQSMQYKSRPDQIGDTNGQQVEHEPFQTSQHVAVVHIPAKHSREFKNVHEHKNHVTADTNLKNPDSEDTLYKLQHVSNDYNETGRPNRRNIHTVKSGVKNVRVKPVRLANSRQSLSKKIKRQQGEPKSVSYSRTDTDPMAFSDGREETSHELQGHVQKLDLPVSKPQNMVQVAF